MLKTKTKLILILFVIVALISTAVYATEATPSTTPTENAGDKTQATDKDETTGEDTISEEDIVQIDKFYSGDDIVIDDLINGNVFAVGKNVTLKGQIAGNFIVIAENLTMEAGTVLYGSLYTVASEATINAQMYDLYAMCDKITIGYYGTTQRNMNIMASETTINGVIYRNAYVEADKLKLDSKCEITGDLIYTAQSDAVYIEQTDNGEDNIETKETTELPASVVGGEKKFTPRTKKLFSKNDEVKRKVDKFIKNNKISNDTSEEQLKSVLVSSIVDYLGINTKGNITNGENAKNVARTIQVPVIVFYVDIAVVALLILALILVLILKKDKTPKGRRSKEQ